MAPERRWPGSSDVDERGGDSARGVRLLACVERSMERSTGYVMTEIQPPRPPLTEDPTRRLRLALYGTAHSHAPGKLRALLERPDVELVGICEPDPQQRERARENPAFAGLRWLESPEEFLSDPAVVAACVEGAEGKCAALARECIAAGKHVWYDKPAGDWETFRWMVETARRRRLHIQMGYMLRYSTAFRQISAWQRAGLLGDLFAVRGHMSTSSAPAARGREGYPGGIAFQLSPHIID